MEDEKSVKHRGGGKSGGRGERMVIHFWFGTEKHSGV